MWLGELVLSGSSTATTHRPIFSNRVTDFCQQTSRTNDARTLDRFLQGIEYQHSNHSIPLPSSLIFNQPSLLITFFHTFTITFAFFTPFRKFNTFSLFFSALQRIRTRLSLLSTLLIHCQSLERPTTRSKPPLAALPIFSSFSPLSRSRTHFGAPRPVL